MVKGLGDVVSVLFSGRPKSDEGRLVPESCLLCGASLTGQELFLRYRICPVCRFHYSITARERITLLADGRFKEKYRTISSLDPLAFSGKVSYRKRLFRDQRRTGLNEAAIVGHCRIGGVKAILLLLDFSFMGGSLGCVVGEKVALAFELAARKHRPLVAVITSGGVRLQEGSLSLMQLAKTTAAANRLQEAAVPHVCVLANPTTGQVYAGFTNLADVIIAEPGALIGFASLRLLQEAAAKPLPLGSHTAEAHLEHGLIDVVVDREALRETLVRLVGLLAPQHAGSKAQPPKGAIHKPKGKAVPDPWQTVQLARHPARPTARDYVSQMVEEFAELHGDRLSGDDAGVVFGIGKMGGCPVVVAGQQRIAASEDQGNGLRPHGLRKAQRAMNLAARFRLPLITLIDTPGPATTLEAEEAGIGNAIATTMALMTDLPLPTVAVVIGEGGREGALALGIADRILMLENAIYSPISPEGAAGLMYRDASKAEEAARSLRLTAADCLDRGLIDGIVAEPAGGAHNDPKEAARILQRAILHSLAQLQKMSLRKLLKRRHRKFRNMGEYTSYFRVALAREIEQLQSAVAERRSKRAKRAKGRKGAQQQPQAGAEEKPKTGAEETPTVLAEAEAADETARIAAALSAQGQKEELEAKASRPAAH